MSFNLVGFLNFDKLYPLENIFVFKRKIKIIIISVTYDQK